MSGVPRFLPAYTLKEFVGYVSALAAATAFTVFSGIRFYLLEEAESALDAFAFFVMMLVGFFILISIHGVFRYTRGQGYFPSMEISRTFLFFDVEFWCKAGRNLCYLMAMGNLLLFAVFRVDSYALAFAGVFYLLGGWFTYHLDHIPS